MISATENGNEPGALSLSFNVYTEARGSGSSGFSSGGDVLYPMNYQELEGERRAIRSNRVVKATAGAKVVTIDAETKTEKDELQLAAYLREFQRQTQLTVLASWPKDASEPKGRLSQDIVKQPIADALDQLCTTYRCGWVQDGGTVRIRYKMADPKKPASSAIQEGS